ncbi:unnamed protein product [Coccothraustes coccothraustes]
MRGRRRGTGVPYGAVQRGDIAPEREGRPARPGAPPRSGPAGGGGREVSPSLPPLPLPPPCSVRPEGDRARLKAEEKKKVEKDVEVKGGHQAKEVASFNEGLETSALSGEGKEDLSLPS